MRTEYVREFVALARFLSFTETASILNMSQPTLSKHINALEREAKTALFKRSGSSLELTKAGKLALSYAFDILEAEKQFKNAAHMGASYSSAHLRFGGVTAIRSSLALINKVEEKLAPKYGNNFIDIVDGEAAPMSVIDMGRPDAPDILFAYIDDTDEIEPDTEVRQVLRSPLSVIVAKSHPLASRSSVTLDDLQTEVFIKLEGNWISNSWRFIEASCLNAGYMPRCKHTYFPQATQFHWITRDMTSEVLVLTNDYFDQFQSYLAPDCKRIPIDDPRAYLPVSIAYSMSNANPLIDEALELLLDSSKKEGS